MKKHPVKLIKLTSGEEIVTMYINSKDDMVEVLQPLTAITTGSLMRPKVTFNKFSTFSKWDEPVKITKSHIVSISEPTKDLVKFYRQLRKFVKHVFDEQMSDEIVKDTEDLSKLFSKQTISKDAIYTHVLESVQFPKGPIH